MLTVDPKKLAFHSERLVLHVLDASFAARMLDYHLRNEDHFRNAGPVLLAEFFTKKFQKSRLEQEMELTRMDRMLRLCFFKKEDTGLERIIGDVNFGNFIRGAMQGCTVGYKVDKDEIGRGYMTEALTRGLEVAFDELRLHRVEANIMPRNKASRRVVEKIGFHEEGHCPKLLKINGIWEDHIRYAILNPKEM
jgi:[ribosomal protein S5]-alanine N-acetyltransferase